MAVKKQKKSTKKSAKKSVGKAAKKILNSKLSQKLLDEALVKISPSLIDNVNKNLGKMGDLTFLAGKIFFRAQEISQNLKNVRAKKAAARKRR